MNNTKALEVSKITLPNEWTLEMHRIGEWYDLVDKAGNRIETQLTEYGAELLAYTLNEAMEKAIADLRAQLAERDAQLAALTKLMDAVDQDYIPLDSAAILALMEARKATRQPKDGV